MFYHVLLILVWLTMVSWKTRMLLTESDTSRNILKEILELILTVSDTNLSEKVLPNILLEEIMPLLKKTWPTIWLLMELVREFTWFSRLLFPIVLMVLWSLSLNTPFIPLLFPFMVDSRSLTFWMKKRDGKFLLMIWNSLTKKLLIEELSLKFLLWLTLVTQLEKSFLENLLKTW